MVTKSLAEPYDSSASLHDYWLFASHQFTLFLSYLFLVYLVNPFFPSSNKGGNSTLFLGLSVPGKVSQCSASVLVLLASFLNSATPIPISKSYLTSWYKLSITLSKLNTAQHLLVNNNLWCLLVYMYRPMVSCKISLLRKLQAALLTRIFDSFMYCPFVFSKISLCSFLMVALPTRILDSFMYCPFVSC